MTSGTARQTQLHFHPSIATSMTTMNRISPLQVSSAAALLATISLASAVPAAASAVQNRGMAFAWAAGLSERTDPAQQPGTSNPTLLKAPLGAGGAPSPWAPVNTAPTVVQKDYSSNALFGILEDVVEVDAHSIGKDMIPAVYENTMIPNVSSESDNWLAWVVSVKEGAVGTPGSYLASRGTQPVGADLLSFYASGSQGIAQELIGENAVEATWASMGYPSTAATRDIDALDYGIGVHTFASNAAQPSVLFGSSNQYFFSLTPDSATALNGLSYTHMFSSLGVARPGHIYCLLWDDVAGWGSLRIDALDTDLGLDLGEDVDALALNATESTTYSYVISTPLGSRPQLLYSEGQGTHAELMDREAVSIGPISTDIDTPVVEKLDLAKETDDIDGLCGIDPEGIGYSKAVGVAMTSTAGSLPSLNGTTMMGISVERGHSSVTGVDSLMIQVAGWGDAAPEASKTAIYVRVMGNDPMPVGANPTAGGMIQWTRIAFLDRGIDDEFVSHTVPIGPLLASVSIDTHLVFFAAQVSQSAPAPLVIAGSLVTQLRLDQTP